MKKFTMGGMFIGSGIGSYAPLLWGGSVLSMASIILTGVGGIVGIYLGFKLGRMMGV